MMTSPDKVVRFQLAWLSVLFFGWGAITSLNDIIIPHMKQTLALTYVQAMLIQFTFFAAYFITSLPFGFLVDRLSRRAGLIIGLLICGLGCLLCAASAATNAYAFYLAALFVVASGVVLLQVTSNPYVAALGRPETATGRLVLTQAFNSLGAAVMPYLCAVFFLSAGPMPILEKTVSPIQILYLCIAAVLVAAAWITRGVPRETGTVPTAAAAEASPSVRLIKNSRLWFGATALFLYVGAEVAIGSFLANYLQWADPSADLAAAGKFVSLYWTGALAGRFIGGLLLRRLQPAHLLAFNALVNVLLIGSALLIQGRMSVVELTVIGLFNSIMFPTIFSMAIQGLGAAANRASGMLCMAVVGGAIVPMVQAAIADRFGLVLSFLTPFLCYLIIFIYALMRGEIRSFQHIEARRISANA